MSHRYNDSQQYDYYNRDRRDKYQNTHDTFRNQDRAPLLTNGSRHVESNVKKGGSFEELQNMTNSSNAMNSVDSEFSMYDKMLLESSKSYQTYLQQDKLRKLGLQYNSNMIQPSQIHAELTLLSTNTNNKPYGFSDPDKDTTIVNKSSINNWSRLEQPPSSGVSTNLDNSIDYASLEEDLELLDESAKHFLEQLPPKDVMLLENEINIKANEFLPLIEKSAEFNDLKSKLLKNAEVLRKTDAFNSLEDQIELEVHG